MIGTMPGFRVLQAGRLLLAAPSAGYRSDQWRQNEPAPLRELVAALPVGISYIPGLLA